MVAGGMEQAHHRHPPTGARRMPVEGRHAEQTDPKDDFMTHADHDIRLNTAQMEELFTVTAFGDHFSIGVDTTDPSCAAGMATLLEGAGGLWHACGESFDAASLSDLAALAQATKAKLGQCAKPQGSHKGEHGYTFRSASAVLVANIAPMSPAALPVTFQHVVNSGRFAMVLGARGPEDRHVLACLLAERAGMMRPLARFGSEWIDDLVDVTSIIASQ
jgi:hypothetical protein